jgi:cyclic beta-1,2-glucan synthetase
MPRNSNGLRASVKHAAEDWWQRTRALTTQVGPRTQEEPLRAELFSADQMAQHAKRLAAVHVLSTSALPDRLLTRLASNERVLLDVGRQLAAAPDAERRFSPAAEWLLDNFYLIEEEIRTARRHLPRGYSRQLPQLAHGAGSGDMAGLPRVYHLALQMIAHGDGHFGRGTLGQFIASYQSIRPLLLGELWAMPIMLRLALIENLRRVAARVAAAYDERATAGVWADSMLEVAENAPSDLVLLVADMARSKPPLTNAFVAEFARRLQGRGASLALPLTWIELRLAESGQTIQQLVQMEGQQQAANQVSVSNSIGSLRLLGNTDWRDFVETLSEVEQTLRDDPIGAYAQMDFGTRDRYRHVVEAIARLSEATETEVARQAVALSASAVAADDDDSEGTHDGRRAHVGYYLIGAGRAELERAVAARVTRWRALARWASLRAVPLYSGALVLAALSIAAWPLLPTFAQLRWPWWAEAALALVVLIPASQAAVALVNWLVTLSVTPQRLPRMDYSFGISSASRTLVVVPTMLGSAEGIDSLVDALEVRFLANRDPNLHFGLLTDLHDAATEHLPADAELVELAASRIDALNAKYRPAGDVLGSTTFYLFHRPRRWNPRERVWMGYERKRGKLADLNALLRGETGTGPGERFSRIVGEPLWLSAVRYVITLDTDTELPRGAAAQMVATMAHPLNRPRFGTGQRRDIVVDGYGILQPRIGASLPTTNRSMYSRLHGGEPGIDPYTRAVSDVYQDLFGEGSFIGKGIYDVDAFEHALADRLPENRILSHDLLEGSYARCGLLSDVQLIEGAPANYSADVARRHRWIRGDWQLLGWLRRHLHALPTTPINPLSELSRAKILDNLRRSLVPTALLAVLLAGWFLLPEPGWWTLFAVMIGAFVPLATHFAGWLRRPLARLREGESALPVAAASQPAVRLLVQGVHALACLPHEAAYSADAITRTLWRVYLSKRRLLEWRPSADVSVRTLPGTLADLLRSLRMLAVGPVLAIACAVGLGVLRPEAIPWAAPVLVLWLLSPVLVWWIDRPLARKPVALTPSQEVFLRRLARRTWGFFELHVAAADHHLPPDNVQEQPVARIAHRTSPTNMGFALLAGLAARGFGYLTTGQLLDRIDAALTTMEGMPRYRGHFFNWYDTRTLEPLRPRYVSTVDSGNLAAQLLTLRSGLLAVADEPVLPRCWQNGVQDSFGVLKEALIAAQSSQGQAPPAALAQFEQLLLSHENRPPVSLSEWNTMLTALEAAAEAIAAALGVTDARDDTTDRVAGAGDVVEAEAACWARLLLQQCRAGRDALRGLALEQPGTTASAVPSPRQLHRAAVAGLPPDAGDGRTEAGLLMKIEELAARAVALTSAEHGFLYDDSRHLMTIGYNVEERRADSGFYDLLASEARLGVFVAIAQGHIGQEGWFALGRLLTSAAGAPVLLSWSGSMFEYLMPMLLMPSYENTLLHQTCRGAVERQIEYGRQRGVPWGISESGYNATDAALNYQYRAFGVPGLGLKRGLADDLVITPHATIMALMVAPQEAFENLEQLAASGAAGRYGMYEAVDYTASRLPRGQKSAVVRSFMAHHQGMGLLALTHLLQGRPMQRHFEADPSLQATLLLLQERVPRVVTYQPAIVERAARRGPAAGETTPVRVISTVDSAAPEVQLLSNGRYHVMVTSGGGGYSRWNDLAVTRWQEDTTTDAWGSFIYLRDAVSGDVWSTAHQPTRTSGDHYEAIFTEGRAEFRRRDFGIETHTEIVVSPEDDVELRRIRITNGSATRRTVEITSYTEVVLASAAADALHPAFSKLFVQTEILERPAVVLCTRRARSPDEAPPWMFQLMATHVRGGKDETTVGAVTHETDRAEFIGRGNNLAAPRAMSATGPLSNRAGPVLDPVAASRCAITLAPDQSVIVDVVIGAGASRADCVALAEKYRDRRLAERVVELAWTHSQVVLRQLNATDAEGQLYARLAGAVIYAQPGWRADNAVLSRNRRGQSGLWGYGISGDLPIVLLQIGKADNIELARQLVQAHAWWRLKGLAVDLVIWNEERDIYRHRLQEQITGLIAAGVEAHYIDRPGGVFVRHVEQIAHEDRMLLQSVARVVFSDSRGSLAEQLNRRPPRTHRPARFVPSREVDRRTEVQGADVASAAARHARAAAASGNGIGTFSADGSEYVLAPPMGDRPPAPWANVIANPRFGCVVSEAGSAYTWCENAHMLRLTPWHNDPVADPSGEAIYLRDEETGSVWAPTSLPCVPGGQDAFTTRHGFGYSVFEHTSNGIRAELTVFVALDAAVKFSMLRLVNKSDRPRKLSATGYVEWVLGDLRSRTAPHIITEVAADSGALYARNPYSTDYGDWIGFFDTDEVRRESASFTCDRAEFIGRNGSMRQPAALSRARLGGRVGPALDPCAAIQVPVSLLQDEAVEIVFRLGMGRSVDEAEKLVNRFRGLAACARALDVVRGHWRATLGALQVRTPDPRVDALVNGWLLYQTIGCRIWARSGYYQSGGAFGFRDQLQDAMALVHSQPQLLRAQLLLCASRQFVEGDVQHWWHPPQGRGVRTRMSDDFLWLPLGLVRYVEATGDMAVLDENVSFLEGRRVNPPDDSYYDLPVPSGTSASLYQHAMLAVWHGLRFGEHGLPLIGTGDWNDGMNLVGHAGRGESVWLGFFLCEVLRRFGALAERHGDDETAARCVSEHARLQARLEEHGWDGAWYRRAYFDDGTPLGSAANAECQIDSIAQSWAVLSGAAAPERARVAMDSMYTRLVNPDAKIAMLLDPPFDQKGPSPGYIAGYLPGVRENGGQYNHAAIWAAMACAALGQRERAWSLLEIINPLNRTATREGVARYKVEPYVMAADVYTVEPHTGRGGWSWYTGSAGWLYRLIVESLLGVRLQATGTQTRLAFSPCLPADWPGYVLEYRFGRSLYRIEFVQQGRQKPGSIEVQLDGAVQDGQSVPLRDDGTTHAVVVRLGGAGA